MSRTLLPFLALAAGLGGTSCRTCPDTLPVAPRTEPSTASPALTGTAAASPWDARAAQAPSDLEVVDGVVLAIHGGAGALRREDLTPALDAAYRAAIAKALLAGYAVLENGGTSEDAVVASIRPLEDSPLFNAGRGAVLNDEGEVELDASFMAGRDGNAGAVAGVRTVRHPIEAARAVLERSEHVLLAGEGADRFAEEQDLETAPPTWFVTPHRQRQLEFLRAREEGRLVVAPRPSAEPAADPVPGPAADPAPEPAADLAPAPAPWGPQKFGTVGAVALDREGHLAAGTSTGGMARKAFGRVGDSPVVGAGTWASDATCAVSCTGWGEFFIRRAIAHQVHARMAFGGANVAGAARAAVLEDLPAAGGSGGAICLDAGGRLAAPFTTHGMYRGWVDAEGRVTVRIHADER